MDALEFASELKRMCGSYEGCGRCDLFKYERGFLCDLTHLEEAIPIVEKWSVEHPKVTNLDHVAEELEKLGYKVDKAILRKTCPAYKNRVYVREICREEEIDCITCRKWWDEEYKEQKE